VVRIRCEICEAIVAAADPKTLKAPLHSDMLQPPEPGFEFPWPEPVGWLHLYCPFCRKRFCVDENRVWLEDRTYLTVPGIDTEPETPETIEETIVRLTKEQLTPTEIGNQLGITRQKVVAVLRRDK